MKTVPILHNVSIEQFNAEIRPAGKPVLMKALLGDWPIVGAATRGNEALVDFLMAKATTSPINVAVAAPEAQGRYHYSDDALRLNYALEDMPLKALLARLMDAADDPSPPSLAGQSLNARTHLPAFVATHAMPLLPPSVPPRMWICNAAKVAIHNDELENVAVCAAGRRRFTLFPPEQISNLYPGPFELTPGGTPISMVHLDAPDMKQYPRFADALACASVAELEPGDALYVPYQWYHHVEAIDPINILVNYWWDDARHDLGSPWDALLHAMIAVRGLPADRRAAWRAAFDHYAFLTHGEAGAHLPEAARGVLADIHPEDVAKLRADLVKNLSATDGKRVGPLK
ncbi:MAG: cupin-like domain-containing protein [Sphingopyxis sp.]